jgi:hypothetical protein
LSLTAPNSYQYIYVVDNAAKEVSKFETFSEVEPGSYNVEVNVLETEPAVMTASRNVWGALETAAAGTQLPVLPACEVDENGVPRDGAALFIRNNLNCRHAVLDELRDSPWWQQMWQGFSSLLNHLEAYLGINNQAMVSIRFADGSSILLRVEMGQDTNTGQVQILSVEVVEATNAMGDPLPVSPESAQSMTVSMSVSGVGDLEYLFGGWNFVVNRICSYSQGGASCRQQGSRVVCEVRGTVGC